MKSEKVHPAHQASIAQHEGGRCEPVAWMYENARIKARQVFLDRQTDFNDNPLWRGWTETPLYAHPPATRPAALSEDEVEALAKQIAKRTMKDLRIDRYTGMLYVAAVEAAKRAISHLSPRINITDETLLDSQQAMQETIARRAEEVRDLNKRLAVAYVGQMIAEEEVARLREAALGSTAGLAAALSILQRANSQHVEPCKAVASDKMFAQMMTDYQKQLDASRAALNEQPGGER